jgi:3-oxoacyl-[acyl-carrier protein] reductase
LILRVRHQVDGKDVALGIPESTRKMMTKNAAAIPLARAGQPEEAAGGVFSLCIPEASYITGMQMKLISFSAIFLYR